MKAELEQKIGQACRTVFNVDAAVELTRPDEQFGDYATNIAMQLAGRLGRKPRDVAEELKTTLEKELADHLSKIDIAGPGFINLTLTDELLRRATVVKPGRPAEGQVIVAEYSDPNPFKVLHAGHLYTTIVGDAIGNLLAAAGGEVHRVNFGGDVGLHVAKNMWAIMQFLGGEFPEKLNDVPEAERSDWLSARYIEGNDAYESDEQAKAAIIDVNKKIYSLHAAGDRDSAFAQIYWTCRQWSYDYFEQFYEQLGVHAFEKYYPESATAELGTKTVREQLAHGVYAESDGAIVFKGEPYGLHTRVFINSHGLPTYEAKDVGLIMTKWADYHFDRSIIITANDIVEYMKVVLKSVEQFAPEPARATTHITHGVVKLPGGVKMSSRKGNFLRATDILDAARDANRALVGKDDEQAVLAAVKYAFLKVRTGGDVIYDPAESVSLEGNSGPYLQYAHARARSILRKVGEPAGVDSTAAASGDSAGQTAVANSSSSHEHKSDAASVSQVAPASEQFDPAERSLARKLGEYAEAVDHAVAELMPHHICTYLYELAQAFNRFYEHNRVIGDEREVMRLSLVEQYATTLKSGLELLGIAAPDRM